MSYNLSKEIVSASSGFNFYHAVHLIERYLVQEFKEQRFSYNSKQVRIRFRTHNSIAFPGSDVVSIEKDDKNGCYTLYLSFMGLYGVSSPLPSYFTEPLSRGREEYDALKFFLDIFSHRIYELFYNAWKKYRYHIQYVPGGGDDFSKVLHSFVGMGFSRSLQEDTIEYKREMAKLPFAKLMFGRVRSTLNLQKLLRYYFNFSRVSIQHFAPARIKNPALCIVGGESVTLGSTILGTEIIERTGSFHIEIGPLPYNRFKKFLDQGREKQSIKQDIRELIQDFLDAPLEYSITVSLDYLDPECAEHSSTLGERVLGWDTWLGVPNENITLNI